MDPLTLGLIGTGASKLLGSIFGFFGGKGDEERKWNAQRGTWEHNASKNAARNQLVNAIMRGYGIDSTVHNDEWDKLLNPVPFPDAPTTSFMSALGSGLSGVAPYVGNALATQQQQQQPTTPNPDGLDGYDLGNLYFGHSPLPGTDPLDAESIAPLDADSVESQSIQDWLDKLGGHLPPG